MKTKFTFFHKIRRINQMKLTINCVVLRFFLSRNMSFCWFSKWSSIKGKSNVHIWKAPLLTFWFLSPPTSRSNQNNRTPVGLLWSELVSACSNAIRFAEQFKAIASFRYLEMLPNLLLIYKRAFTTVYIAFIYSMCQKPLQKFALIQIFCKHKHYLGKYIIKQNPHVAVLELARSPSRGGQWFSNTISV